MNALRTVVSSIPNFSEDVLAGIVTRLAYQKRNKRRVNVYLDDAYAFALPDTEAVKLKIGQRLEDDQILQLRRLDSESKAFDRAVRFLGHRPRSRHEIQTYLQKADFPPQIQASVIARLETLGYIDDEAFVTWWLDNRSRFNPRGARALRQELRLKGIDAALIEQALIMVDEEEQAMAAGLARASRWRHLSQQAFSQKMLGHLQRRGFSYAIAGPVTEQLWERFGSEDDQTSED